MDVVLGVSEARLWARVGPLWSLRFSQGSQQYTVLHCSLVSEHGQQGFELTLKGFSSFSMKQLKLLITLLTKCGERQYTNAVMLLWKIRKENMQKYKNCKGSWRV